MAVYSDGHKWCFACGFYVPSNGVVDIANLRLKLEQRRKENGIVISLPGDFTHIIPEKPRQWLKKYGLTEHEIQTNKIGWSGTFNRLIYPVYDHYGNLLMYQGRLFETIEGSKRARFHTQGRPEKVDAYFGVNWENNLHDSVCVVEDVISAIKVSRVCPALPLWGSELSLSRIIRIAEIFKNLIIWLDHDKASYQARCEIKARPFFDHVSGLYTIQDPKAHGTEELKKCLIL